MSIEPIGFITLLLGMLCMVNGARFAMVILCLLTLLGAAAALQLPALGGSSIQPSHLLVLFLVGAVLLRPVQTQAALASLAYPGPGFWFAAYILFSVVSSFFLPRIFAGATLVYSSARDPSGMMSTVAAPLAPGSSNLSQSVYLLGDLACFAVVAGLARLGYARFIALQLIIASIVCFAFALIDWGTFLTGQSHLLDIIRNANYTMHTAEAIHGFKRIVGPFPEASIYGAIALAYFSFTLMLWLERVQSRMAGLATLLICPTIVLCTSTTAYIAGIFAVCMFVLFCLKRLIRGPTAASHVTFLVITLFLIPCAIVALSLVPDAWDSIAGLVNTTVSDKLQSQSGEERTAWNTLALIAFVDTATFGAGLGTVRASSFIAALLSNVGLSGTLLFATFLYSLVRSSGRRISGDRETHAIGNAAIMASIAQIGSAAISGSGTDLGLLFSTTAGLAVGCLAGPYVARRPATRTLANRRPPEASASLTRTPTFATR
ncbi:hypothetical protein FHS26_002186 [Rhizobium pisi]|uniref:O-antigen ligase domain-containing protein n=1 Tax=Rhizobium pisi TaxID=574561 RepID=A0A3R9C2P3_9HYPH|nr:hypothetical protein [Rhizobium pisi]MBB3134456.1 hypothetical protein [Rhizobium pisi]RSB79625.1 hypothetical protein EFD55_11415 [Rhizobium pisi]TCA60641.1 hypothetical protein E0J16_07565 [Rhizobium pisi]